MLAIGKGAQQEILEQIKMVGVNNILITPIVQPKSRMMNPTMATAASKRQNFLPGFI